MPWTPGALATGNLRTRVLGYIRRAFGNTYYPFLIASPITLPNIRQFGLTISNRCRKNRLQTLRRDYHLH